MEGGVVPKNLYRVDLEGTSGEHEHSLYHSISLSRGQTHHVFIESDDPGAVLTWDFDVMRHNVVFTVLHKSRNNENGDIAGKILKIQIIIKSYILHINNIFKQLKVEI